MFDNIYLSLIACEFCYINKQSVNNCLLQGKMHVGIKGQNRNQRPKKVPCT